MWDNGDRVIVKGKPLMGVGTVKEVQGAQRIKVKFDSGRVEWYYMNEVKAAPKGRSR